MSQLIDRGEIDWTGLRARGLEMPEAIKVEEMLEKERPRGKIINPNFSIILFSNCPKYKVIGARQHPSLD